MDDVTLFQALHSDDDDDRVTDDSEEEQGSFSCHIDEVSDEVPPSLLSYFETSKSRAALCEKLILQKAEDLNEDVKGFRARCDVDLTTKSEKVSSEIENEENTSTDISLLPAQNDTEALCSHDVSACLNFEGEAAVDEYMECGKNLALEVCSFESSLEEERKKGTEYQMDRDKRLREEMKKEEQKRLKERDFQDELRKIKENDKIHQAELEMIRKRAQEKLELEKLHQQEVISSLQQRVEEERKMRKEEQEKRREEERKKKREKERRKREEEKIKMEAKTKKMMDEMKWNKEEEENSKIEKIRLHNEEDMVKKNKEEEERKKEEEISFTENNKEQMEEVIMSKKEENRKIEKARCKEERQRITKKEENREQEGIHVKEEDRTTNDIKLKEELTCRRNVEEDKWKKNRIKKEGDIKNREEDENSRKREEKKISTEVPTKQLEEEKRRNIHEEIWVKEQTRKKEELRMNNRDEECKRKRDEERLIKQDAQRKKLEVVWKEERNKISVDIQKMEGEIQKEEKKEELDKEECADDEWRKMKEKTMETEITRIGDRKLHQIRLKEEDEKREMKEEWTRMKGEDAMRKEKERKAKEKKDKYRKIEEIKVKEEMEINKSYDADSKKTTCKNNTKYGGNRYEDERNTETKGGKEKEDYMKTTKEENEQTEEKVGQHRTTEEIRLKQENKWMEEEKEKKVRRRNSSMKTQNERETLDNARNPSQGEEGIIQTSSNIDMSMISSTEALNLSSNSVCKTTDREDPVAPGPLLLPELMEQKRLSWMEGCITWSKLQFQNRRKQKGTVRGERGPRRTAESSRLPPLCPEVVLQSSSCNSLQQVTSVTLEDVPGCNLSTLTQCPQLQSLTLRRCGLKALDGISQLSALCYIDVQENDISFVDCENMTSLRVLRLAHNKLTSIHGLSRAENLDLLDLSHNRITRIAGLEAMKKLQWLSLSHNQLISTKGLRDVYTLLHLDCSHNHLVNVEGLDHSALLSTLDLSANSLSEPPSLINHVLLRQLKLDDNSISSLQGLTACWLPLMHALSAAQNRITQLPSMPDFPSIGKLDLRHNCLSELKNVCESLEGCPFLREVHFTDNPLQHEHGWRFSLQRAVPGLRVIDDQETESALSPPAVHHISLPPGSFLTLCQAQLQQTRQLEQQHHRELRNVSSPVDAVKASCRHFTEALQLAEEQRFAHEYGGITVTDKHSAADQKAPNEILDKDGTNAADSSELLEALSQRNRKEHGSPVVIPSVDSLRRTFEERGAAERKCDTFDDQTLGAKMEQSLRNANSIGSDFHNLATVEKTASASVSNCQHVNLKNTAALMIQRWWRNRRQKREKIKSPSIHETGGGRGRDGVNPASGLSYTDCSILGWDYAATVIQAYWRGFALRKKLQSALAAVASPDIDDDDAFEEVDMSEFDFDEAVLEKGWTLPLSEASQQPPTLEPPEAFAESSLYIFPPLFAWRPKQAWVAGEQVDSVGHERSPRSTNRSQSPTTTSVSSSCSGKSEKLMKEWGFTDPRTALLLLQRAQKMNPKRPQQKKRSEPLVCLALMRKGTNELGPMEAQNKPAQGRRNNIKVGETEPGLVLTDKTERLKQERTNEWLHTQTSQHHRISDREHFLPEINSDILNRGRMQPVADPGYIERLRQTDGSRASSSLVAQPWKSNNYPHRISVGRQRQDVPSPKQVTSAPSKRERFSFRDNPAQLSGGWGAGKKRTQVHK